MIDFFDDMTLNDLGVAGTKAATRPKADPKAKFIQMGELNTEQLTHGESRTHWCHVQRDGSVIVTLKNGARLLNSKKPHFVPDGHPNCPTCGHPKLLHLAGVN